MAKKKQQIPITPQMQAGFNRYSQILSDTPIAPTGVNPLASQQQPKQIDLKSYGMTMDRINQAIGNTNNEIPSLQQTPSIQSELTRMEKAKADTTTPRTEGEQKAIDTYYNSLKEASKQNTTPDYNAEIKRMQAMKADTTAQRTPGEEQAIDTYLAGLIEAQKYVNSQNKVSQTVSQKKNVSQKKETKKTDEIFQKEEQKDYSLLNQSINSREQAMKQAFDKQQLKNAQTSRENAIKKSIENEQKRKEDFEPLTGLSKYREAKMYDTGKGGEGGGAPIDNYFSNEDAQVLANTPASELSEEDKANIEREYNRLQSQYKRIGNTGSQYSMKQFDTEQAYQDAVKSGKLDPQYFANITQAYDNMSGTGAVKAGVENFASSLVNLPVVAGAVLEQTSKLPKLEQLVAGPTFTTPIQQNTITNLAKDISNMRNQNSENHPVASAAGDIAGAMALYGVANALTEGLASTVGQRMLLGQGIDNVVDTIPRLVGNYINGAYTDENGNVDSTQLGKDFLVDNALNLLGNGIAEVPTAIKAIKSAKNAPKNIDIADALKETGVGVEDFVKQNPEYSWLIDDVKNVEAPKAEVPTVEQPKIDVPQNTNIAPKTVAENTSAKIPTTSENVDKEIADYLDRKDYLQQKAISEVQYNPIESVKTFDELNKLTDDMATKHPEYFDNGNYVGKPKTIAENIGLETPTITESIPAQTNPITTTKNMAQSKVFTNTLSKQQTVNMKNRADIINSMYEIHDKENVIDSATKRVMEDFNKWDDYFRSDYSVIGSDADVVSAMQIVQAKQEQINALISAGADKNEIAKLVSEKQLLQRKLRQAGTESGQLIKAFDYFNGTPEGAIINAERMLDKNAKKFYGSKSNKGLNEKIDKVAEKLVTNSKMDKALSDMGNDSLKAASKTDAIPKTHEEIKQSIINSFERENSSINANFTDSDYEVLTNWVENKMPNWQITDEIEHKLRTGDWYTLDESTPVKQSTNTKLSKAISDLLPPDESIAKEPITFSHTDIANQVRETLNRDYASVFKDFTDDDVEYLTNMIENGASSKELQDMLKTRLTNGIWDIPEDTIQNVNNIFKRMESLDPNSKMYYDLQTQAFWELANASKTSSLADKFDAWRYLAMLGNPKTHARNMIGNALFQGVTGISNDIAALMEAGADKLSKNGIDRTKAIINLFNENDRNLVKGAWADAYESSYKQLKGGSKWNSGIKSELAAQKEAFSSEAMRKINGFLGDSLDAEDMLAMRSKYSTSLAGYLKANGYDDSIFTAERRLNQLMADNTYLNTNEINELKKQVDVLKNARDYAVKQAEYSAFHEDNAFANALSRAGRYLNNSDNKGLNFLGRSMEGVIPFKKTPANILKSGIDYASLPKNITTDVVNLAKGNISPSEYFEKLSKGLTGAGIGLAGFYLGKKGIVNISNEDTKWQDDIEGIQNYSLRVGDKTFTIDWAAPSVMPFLLGAEVANLMEEKPVELNENGEPIADEEKDSLYDKFLDTFTGGLKLGSRLVSPIMDTSMMSGLNNTLSSMSEGDVLDAVTTGLATSTVGYYSQAIPTLAGQLARIIDPTRRSTYSDKDSGIPKSIDKWQTKIENKIPILSMANEPYVNARGETQKNSPFNNPIGNALYQLVSPGYIADVKTNDIDRELRDVYENTSDPKVLIGNNLETSTDYSKRDYTLYTKAKGQSIDPNLEALFASDTYQSADYSQKAKMIKDVYKLAKNIGKSAVDGSDENMYEDTYSRAYARGGTDQYINKLEDKYNNPSEKQDFYEKKKSSTSNSNELNMLENAKEYADNNNYTLTEKAYDVLKEQGEKSFEEYLEYQEIAKDYNSSTSKNGWDAYQNGKYEQFENDYKQILKDYDVNDSEKTYNAWKEGGNTALVSYLYEKQKSDKEAAEWEKYTLKASKPQDKYDMASSVIPTLSKDEFVKTYNAIDKLDNYNGSLSQKEFNNYFNNNGLSYDEAVKIMRAYYVPSGDYTINDYDVIKNNGKWEIVNVTSKNKKKKKK